MTVYIDRADKDNKKPFHIMMIDDDEIDCLAVARQLKKSGLACQLSTVNNISDFDLKQARNADLILLDYHLGIVNGLEVLQASKLAKDVPVILVTGYENARQLDEHFMDSGVMGYINKNEMTPDTLLSNIRYNYNNFHRLQTLNNIASTDELTGVSTRRVFEINANHSLNKIERNTQQSLYLILADIDKFKRINDAHGHLTGDQALKLAATSLQEAFREGDCISRIGGDEFAVILEADSDAVIDSRLSQCLENLSNNPGLPESVHLSCSFGIAKTETKVDLNHLVKQADAALYHVKKSGGNNFKHYDSMYVLH